MDSEAVMRVDELDAKIQMMLYKDQSYTVAYSGAPTIELRDKVGHLVNVNQIFIFVNMSVMASNTFCVQVYVEVRVTEPADFFLLRINECWATQSSQPKEGSVHTLLLNGSEQNINRQLSCVLATLLLPAPNFHFFIQVCG